MGIYDRDYYRKSPRTAQQLLSWTQTAVGVLIAINVACYAAQQIGGHAVTLFLAASPGDVFAGQVWRLLTANFAHHETDLWHILGNMCFLYYLGKEVEQIYGRRDFYILYLSAGVLAILAEVTLLQLTGKPFVPVLGASGAVAAVAILCALFYPQKVVYFMFFLPAPLWLLCVLFIVMNVFRMASGASTGVANLAHLTGALVGLLYRFFDLRWDHVRALLRFRGRAAPRRPRGAIVPFPRGPRESEAKRDPVYQRVDDLLAKISASGMDSLSGEELDFLRKNSVRFQRDGCPADPEKPA